MIALLLITNATFVITRGRRLEQKIAAIRHASEPVSFSQLAPTTEIPPEQNAAVFLRRAQTSVENLTKELHPVYTRQGFMDGLPDKSDLKAIESALKGAPDVIPLLHAAASCSQYDPEVDYTVEPQTFIENSIARQSSLRSACRLLDARVFLLVSQGDREEALETCLWMLRLSRSFDREPAMVGFLVSLACRGMGIRAANTVLRSGPLPQSFHMSLDAELALHDSTRAYVHALMTERVLGIESFQSHRIMLGSFQPWILGDECDYLDLFKEQFDLVERPFSDVAAAGLQSKYQGRIGPLSQSVLPSLLQCRKASDRVLAKTRCLRILNALQARADASGKPEPKLEELGLPEGATIDPFTGKPLQIQKTPKGWLVYSTGENLKDDGGELTDQRDIGLGPVTASEISPTARSSQ